MSVFCLIQIIKEEYKINCGNKSLIYNFLFPNYSYRYLFYLRLYEFCRIKGGIFKIASVIIKFKVHKWSFKTKIEIPTFTVGRGLCINHTTGGIVINSRAKVGDYCYLSNGVIIGQDNINKPENVPIIGNHVHLAPNSKVYGKISIGDNVIIGTDCVVLKSVPANCSVVGNPARIVRKDGIKCNIQL
jgi:serine O-acetyltransferase